MSIEYNTRGTDGEVPTAICVRHQSCRAQLAVLIYVSGAKYRWYTFSVCINHIQSIAGTRHRVRTHLRKTLSSSEIHFIIMIICILYLIMKITIRTSEGVCIQYSIFEICIL